MSQELVYAIYDLCDKLTRPSIVYRPKLEVLVTDESLLWRLSYGNLQAIGETPEDEEDAA